MRLACLILTPTPLRVYPSLILTPTPLHVCPSLQTLATVPSPYQALFELKRVLWPGGALIFTAPFSPVRPGLRPGLYCTLWLASSAMPSLCALHV